MKAKFFLMAIAAIALAGCGSTTQLGNKIANATNQMGKIAKEAQKIKDAVNQTGVMLPERSGAQGSANGTAGNITFNIRGKINHTNYNKNQSSSVSFSAIPTTIEEFEQLQQQLGKEPQGAVALQIMAFEMYRKDPKLGEAALKLNNTQTNYNSTRSRMKEIMNESDTYYARPYLAAAMLVGAKPENGYTPSKPYTVKVRVHPVNKYQNSEILEGTVLYLQIDANGWDTNWRGVEVVRPEGTPYFVVSNCPAMYTQCKKIKGTYKGL